MDKETEIDNFIIYYTSDAEEREQMRKCLKDYIEAEDDGHTEFVECGDCVHKHKESPCPCDSCEQNRDNPTNFAEEE